MPDGDRIWRRPSKRCDSLFSGLANSTVPASSSVRPIIGYVASRIRLYGNEPVNIVSHTTDIVLSLAKKHDEGYEVDTVDAGWEIDNYARKQWGDRRGISIGSESAKVILQNFEQQHTVLSFCDNIYNYMWDVYNRDIYDTVPLDAYLIDYRYDPIQVFQKLDNIRPLLEDEIHKLAQRLVKLGNVKNLRNTPRKITADSVMNRLSTDDLLNY